MNGAFEALIAAARNDDPVALGQLLEMYRNYLQLIATPQIRGKLGRKVSPSDVAQETFVHVKRAFSSFRGNTEAEFLSWLRKILANRLAELVRHHTAKRRDIQLDVELQQQLDESSVAFSVIGKDSGPQSRAIRHEETVTLANALSKLPRDYRDVLTLRHIEELSFAEVAQEMGRSVASVKNLWARAVAKIRGHLGDSR